MQTDANESDRTFHSLSQLMPNLERRTLELMQCMERRQSQSERGLVDVKEVFSHWAFDYTVRFAHSLKSEHGRRH